MKLKAAMGKVVITPEEPAALQGYDPNTFIADPEKDLLDPLYARVLLLEAGNVRKIMISVDCCLTNETAVKVADPRGRPDSCREFIPTFPEGTRKKWAEAAGAEDEGISVHATHTHTAPAHYSEQYTSRIEQLIRELSARLEPVKISVGEGVSRISAFRRPTLRADLSVPVNQTLRVLVIEREDGEPIGVVFNYAVHPTSLRNPVNRLSGDLVGLASANLEREYGESFTAMFLQGFCGDICPVYGDNGPEGDTYPQVVEGSAVLASDIREAMLARKNADATNFTSLVKTVSFPTRQGFYKDTMEVTLFGLSLGDTALLAVSGEMFNEYIAKLERLSPFRHLFLSGLANGYSGYLPTYRAFHDGLGGYEMNTTPYSYEIEELLLRAAQELMEALAAGTI